MPPQDKLEEISQKLTTLIVLQLNVEKSRMEKAKILVRAGVQQSEVARMLGMDKSQFSKILRGETRNGRKRADTKGTQESE